MRFDPLALAPPADRRVAVRVTPDAVRRLRAGHPWLFDRSVVGTSHDGAPGDVAVVFDDRRRFVAVGLYDPASPIRVRVLQHGRPVTVDEALWRDRLGAALARRGSLLADARTTGVRLVHGENDRLPGLVVDAYGTTTVVKAYSAAWLPHLPALLPVLRDVVAPERVVLRLARHVRRVHPAAPAEGIVVVGGSPAYPVPFLEHGLRFEADVLRGQKTGSFLDQRDNRALVGEAATGARVLDVFCCGGGFAAHAAAGGARSVHLVDRSAPAVAGARRAIAANAPDLAPAAVAATVDDAFTALAALADEHARFDVVVVDPPSFAAKQADVPAALRAYRALTRLALAVLEPDGLLVQASCSSRVGADDFAAAVHGAARDAGRPLTERHRTGHPLDHPIGFPEGAYLKALFAKA